MTDNPHEVIRAIDALTEHTDTCDKDPNSRWDAHDHAVNIERELLIRLQDNGIDDAELRDLIDDDDPAIYTEQLPFEVARWLRDLWNSLLNLSDDRPEITEHITMRALSHSLCPAHFVDYAICFDDEDPDCAQIRAIHPCHDS